MESCALRRGHSAAVWRNESMPVYDYKCTRCGKRFEIVTSVSRRDEATCPECGSRVERVWQGKCAFGATGRAGGCSGNCSGCQGCGGH